MPPATPPLDAFGLLVRRAREAKGLTQDALAEALGRSQGFVGDLERGRYADVGSVLIAQLARILDLDPRDQIVAAVERAPSV